MKRSAFRIAWGIPGQIGIEHQKTGYVVLGGRAVGVAIQLVLSFLENDETDGGTSLFVDGELGSVWKENRRES